MIDNRTSDIIWEIKAIAIYSVFYAHLVWTGDSIVGRTIYESIGCIGVPIFMIIAGFFDLKSHSLMKKRMQRLLIPLLVWGTCTFVIRFFTDTIKVSLDGIVQDWFKWIYGCDTWYYFIPVLLWCQLLSRCFTSKFLLILGISSMLLTSFGVIPYNRIFTPYNNPLNLLVYFVLGREFSSRNVENVSFNIVWVVVSSVFVVLFLTIFQIPYYWNIFTPLFTIGIISILFCLLSHIQVTPLLVKIGKLSFVLYLCHMQIAQVLSTRIYSLMGGGVFANIIKVPIALIIILLLVISVEKVLLFIKFGKALSWLGYR